MLQLLNYHMSWTLSTRLYFQVVNRKNNGYGLAADIWSLGCTVLEMLTRQIPYSHLDGVRLFLLFIFSWKTMKGRLVKVLNHMPPLETKPFYFLTSHSAYSNALCAHLVINIRQDILSLTCQMCRAAFMHATFDLALVLFYIIPTAFSCPTDASDIQDWSGRASSYTQILVKRCSGFHL